MIFHVVAAHITDQDVIQWYTGQPGGDFVSERRKDAFDFPCELSAARVVKRLNVYTPLHGYTFCFVPQNCEPEHILGKLHAAILRSERDVV